MLEECGADYTTKKLDLEAGDQFSASFTKININSKVPALVDEKAGVTIVESGAILIYLGEKFGKLLPQAEPARSKVISMVMFQMSAIGPIFGQLRHFNRIAPKDNTYAVNRFKTERDRILTVLNNCLKDSKYVAGDYSIADIACFPGVRLEADSEFAERFPRVSAWLELMAEKPAVIRGLSFGE